MPITLETARERLVRFAEHDAAGASPLYEHLAARAAADDEVAGLLTSAPDDADPALLLAAVHRLVQADPIHPLSSYYPSLGGLDGPDGRTWELFREFVLDRSEAVRELVATRRTRTDEIGRAAVLYPAVAAVARKARGGVGLLEVVCGAGLLLGMDTFSYRYHCDGGEVVTAGPAKAAVGLHCAVSTEEGARFAPLPKKPSIKARVGLDDAPVDVADEDELAWLEACVWADQPDRVRLLRTAAAAQRRVRPDLVAGDVVADLTAAADRVPTDLPLVVCTSDALASLPPCRRDEFVDALADLAGRRPLWWVALEDYGNGLEHVLPDQPAPHETATAGRAVLAVARFGGDTDGTPGGPAGADVSVRALASPHGQRMHWLAT